MAFIIGNKINGSVSTIRVASLGILPTNTGTQNSDAFDAAISAIPANGAQHWVFDPATYNFARTLQIIRQLLLEGVGFDSGVGTVLAFPDGIGGLRMMKYSNVAGRGTGSKILNMRISGGYGFGQPAGSAHGIEINDTSCVENCFIHNFSGNGIHVSASVSAPRGENPANANSWFISRVNISTVGGDGIHTIGSDANAGVAIGCIIGASKGFGVLDDSDLGNFYYGVTCDQNLGGGFKTLGVSLGSFNRSTFLGCYAEGDNAAVLGGNAMWIGGTINEGTTGSGSGMTLVSGNFSGKAVSARFTANSSGGSISLGSSDAQNSGQFMVFQPPATIDDGITNLRLNDVTYCNWDQNPNISRGWGMFAVATPAFAPAVTFTGTDSVLKIFPMQLPAGRIAIEREMWLNQNRHAGRDAVPDSFTDQTATYNQGDIIHNHFLTAGGKLGWACVHSGTLGQYVDENHRPLGQYIEGRTATADGTTTLVLNGLTSILIVGMLLDVGGITANRIIEKHTIGSVNTLVMQFAVPAGSNLPIVFHAPIFKQWGAIDA